MMMQPAPIATDIADSITKKLANLAAIDLAHHALIHVTGNNAAEFLQGQLSCDISTLNSNQASPAALCNQKGRVLAICWVISHPNDGYLLWLNADIASTTCDRLHKFALLSGVNVSVHEQHFHQIGLMGQTIEQSIADFILLPTASNNLSTNDGTLLIRLDSTYPRLLLLTPDEALKQTVHKHIPQGRNRHWLTADTWSRSPVIHPDTIAMFTPHMLDLKQINALSFSKGCYVGQEVIARTEHLGKVKRQLYLVALNGINLPEPGKAIQDRTGATIGHIVQGASIHTYTICLAVLRINAVAMSEIFINDSPLTILQ